MTQSSALSHNDLGISQSSFVLGIPLMDPKDLLFCQVCDRCQRRRYMVRAYDSGGAEAALPCALPKLIQK